MEGEARESSSQVTPRPRKVIEKDEAEAKINAFIVVEAREVVEALDVHPLQTVLPGFESADVDDIEAET
ncbi:hypothetical protein ACLOJK_032913 [Asimina triloba]